MTINYTATRYAGDTGVATTTVAIGDDSNETIAGKHAARVLSVTVDFGIGSDNARTTVAGVAWVKKKRRPIAQCAGRVWDAVSDDDDALGIEARIQNVSEGVSFDVVAHAPDGASGIFEIQIVGVGQ